MQLSTPPSTPVEADSTTAELHFGYLWLIAAIAALGGLLFGYDWVVIGGARPFFEAYFGLHSAVTVGWANSCALVGCFVGSLCAGRASDRLGRKKVLIASALLFAVSSALTGWSHTFHAFILWRIVGGVAIGLASNVSPMYLAEISPASLRGRLVSLNQLALVIGILAAQIANWQIARPVPANATALMLASSWNVQFGWRWMFFAVVVPALLFLFSAPFLPESPRWLMAQGREDEADTVLTRIGGAEYSRVERDSIRGSTGEAAAAPPWRILFQRPARKLLLVGLGLVVLQQGSGINILFNYAADVYRSAGFAVSDVLFNIVITGAINLVFTVIAMLLVDRFGRRTIMLFGCIAVGMCHVGASLAYHYKWDGRIVLVLSLCAIAAYAMSLAPITWVLLSEIFPNRLRAQAMSISVATLWIASFALTFTFPFLNSIFGTSPTFFVYALICFAGFLLVWTSVPETKGRALEDVH